MMTTVTLTEFRSHASGMLSRVEQGETLMVLRHGRPIAEVSPVSTTEHAQPSWKQPALRLKTKGAELSSAILKEREHEGVS
ncbi:MAG: type II toxin-antitoxin system Phd/YefM family antitoxin [Verrucomicrobiia bacterium]|jgi:prevent-host-death family protein